jgi:hypothetical protein
MAEPFQPARNSADAMPPFQACSGLGETAAQLLGIKA